MAAGRGFAEESQLSLANDLCDKLGAGLACSRPLTEGVNWLPTERYVGVSGLLLTPKVYLAAGISGQKPQVTTAKKSIANFKDRSGMNVGAKVTLRGDKMWEFLDRLFNVALPRVRDFRGISANAFDGRGNYALGIKEQLIFPEIEYDKIDKIRGMDVVICTTAQTDEEARELLTLVGAPFER